jgi:osmotically-inducible protein OsmY
MDRYNDEDRQRNRNRGGQDRSFSADRSNRFRDDEDRYSRDDSDFDRYSRNRYGRDSESNRYAQSGYGNQDRFNSQYSSNDRSTGGSDRWEYRPQEDYRSLRDDTRYDNSRSFSQRAYNEYDRNFDSNSNLGGYPSGRKDWDYDRTSSNQGYNSSQGSGYNQYGSNQYGSGQSTSGTNYGSSYGSQRPGYSGSSGQNSGYGSSNNYNQEYGRNSGQGYNSNFSSSYGSQQGQGNYNQGQSRWGSESSFESKSGKGPKGYRRSDERIREEISDLLTSHHEVDPSEVEIKVSNCEVTLTGTVNSRHEKRLIEDLASQISGVSDVTNQLRVQPSQDQSRSSSDGQYRSGQSQGLSGQASGSQKEGSQQSSKSIQ